MAETVPMIFAPRLGGLFPSSPGAEKAMANIKGPVRVKITRMQGNNRRIALYWIVLAIAAPMLADRFDGPALTDKMLHRVLKREGGLAKPLISKKTGEIYDYDFDSISFDTMNEPERNDFIQWSFETLSKWLGVPVEALTAEACQAA